MDKDIQLLTILEKLGVIVLLNVRKIGWVRRIEGKIIGLYRFKQRVNQQLNPDFLQKKYHIQCQNCFIVYLSFIMIDSIRRILRFIKYCCCQNNEIEYIEAHEDKDSQISSDQRHKQLNQFVTHQKLPPPPIIQEPSKQTFFSQQQQPKPKNNIIIPKSFQKKKVDVSNFFFKNLTGETQIKKPGEIKGEQFNIDSCLDCHLYLFDYSANVYIDDCRNCTIYIGPCQSSVFVRSCINCQIITICSQFRMNKSKNIIIWLFSKSQPVIQNSKEIVFNCIPSYGYEGIHSQMQSAGIDIWKNNWYLVYDFTKENLDNFSYDCQYIEIEKVLEKACLKKLENVFPYLNFHCQYEEKCIVVIQENEWINGIVSYNNRKVKLLRSNKLTLSQELADILKMDGQVIVLLLGNFDSEDFNPPCRFKVIKQKVEQLETKLFMNFGDQK